jgi:anti-sigma-K factor RskA
MGGSHIDDVDIAGYALGALEPGERQVIDHHIRTCQQCAERVALDVRTVGMLPFAVSSQLKPPPDVKAALFARIAHSQQAATAAALPTQQRPVATHAMTIPASRPTASASSATSATEGAATPHLAVHSSSRSNWMTAIVAAPLLLALVVVGSWSFQMRSQLSSQDAALSSQADELSSLKATLANFGSGDVQEYQLQPQAGAPQAEGQLLLSPDQKDAIVRVDLNTQQASGSAVILMNNNGKIEPLGEVVLDERGQGQVNVSFDEPLSQGQSIQIEAKPVDPSVADSQLLLTGTVNGMSDPGFGANAAP